MEIYGNETKSIMESPLKYQRSNVMKKQNVETIVLKNAKTGVAEKIHRLFGCLCRRPATKQAAGEYRNKQIAGAAKGTGAQGRCQVCTVPACKHQGVDLRSLPIAGDRHHLVILCQAGAHLPHRRRILGILRPAQQRHKRYRSQRKRL